MSVFADTTGGDPTQDFFDISWCDGAVGQGSNVTLNITGGNTPGAYTVAQVTYSGAGATTGMATADRLFTLVNTTTGQNWAFPILVMPLMGGVSPFTGDNMTANGETGVVTGNPNPIIFVTYDISNGGGAGIQGFDTSGNPIATPRNVVLYHELSHAFHEALNQNPFPQNQCSGSTDDEPAAEIDENVMRSELGLCLRDVCNHGGGSGSGDFCGGVSRPACTGFVSGGGGPTSGSTGCFIVSAATGSPESAEVIRLRQLRDRVAAHSSLSGQLIGRIYGEYERFSPAMAKEIEQSTVAKMGALTVVVRPLIAWYTLAGTLAMDSQDQVKLSHAAQDLLDACPRVIGIPVSKMLDTIKSGLPLPKWAPKPLHELMPAIQQATQLPLASWAILDPLIRAWSITTQHRDAVSQVFKWLGSAPLETLPQPCKCGALDKELEAVASFFRLNPSEQRRMGARLAEKWPGAADALTRHGFFEAVLNYDHYEEYR